MLVFEYKGIIVDCMIIIFYFWVMIVFVMLNSIDEERKVRIRDMDVIVWWMNNVFFVNDVFGGVIKFDYIGFYYNVIYGFVYVL